MSSAKFPSLLDLDQNPFILNTIKDPLVPQFVFELLLQRLIKEKRSTVLVLLAQNLQHYSAVLMKCGLNLKNHIDNGLIQVIDTFDYDIDYDFAQFKQDIQTKLVNLPEPGSFLLVDDIHVLDSGELSVKNIYGWILELSNHLRRKHCGLFIGATVIPNHKSKWNGIVNNLIYSFDVWMDCDKPSTGYSQQINGLLKCFYQNDPDRNVQLNYKISNRNILFTKLFTKPSYI